MRFIKSTILALTLCAVAGVAIANEKDTSATCVAAAGQVATALNGAQSSDAARKEKRLGLEACNAGFYHQGMVHYARAMELLGGKLAQS